MLVGSSREWMRDEILLKAVPFAGDQTGKLAAKTGDAESLGVLANLRGITGQRLRLEVLDRGDDRFGRLLGKEEACFTVNNGFRCAAAAEGDDGSAAGLCFDRQDAEILVSRENEGLGLLQMLLEAGVALKAEELDVGCGAVEPSCSRGRRR